MDIRGGGVKWKSVKGKRGQYEREEVTVRVIFTLPMPEILQPCCCDSLVTDWHLKPALTLVQTTPPVSLLFNFMTAQRVTPGSRFLSKSKRLWAERQRIHLQSCRRSATTEALMKREPGCFCTRGSAHCLIFLTMSHFYNQLFSLHLDEYWGGNLRVNWERILDIIC